ncbi:hypothetical protein BYT27DRAFT_6612564 [Phlegmacium glaucopus]|nr:hypothetical protein BYT27DRAFT_6612564 [Phlegmacium glaucopus]
MASNGDLECPILYLLLYTCSLPLLCCLFQCIHFDHVPEQNYVPYDGLKELWQPESESVYVARPRYGVRNDFWEAKYFWHRERHYVAIPNMEVW